MNKTYFHSIVRMNIYNLLHTRLIQNFLADEMIDLT